jgi:hypothetical protein
MFAQRDPLVVALSQSSKTLEHRVQSYFDMLAEACVMKTERDKCEISGERSETYSRWDAVRPDGIPYSYTFNGAGIMKSLPLH